MELQEAADRGVRVRLLLDDNGIPSALDRILAALADHPGIEVRLFNPFVTRSPKFIGFLTDFTRLNRRMHNKSLTAGCLGCASGLARPTLRNSKRTRRHTQPDRAHPKSAHRIARRRARPQESPHPLASRLRGTTRSD
jgi:hypothetical protein